MSPQGFDRLKAFFESRPVARQATGPLARQAEVALLVDGGAARFTMESGAPRVLSEPARDPDFTLTLPEEAVSRITSLEGEEVGEFGVEFFRLVLSRDPATKVRVRIDAPTTRLLSHGYLGVVALGGMKVGWWLLKNGVKNPKSAIERLRGVKR